MLHLGLLACVAIKFAASQSNISVDSVRPLYGPVAGGTRVTIIGQFISVSTVSGVFFGQNQGSIDRSAACILV